jgi:hypothetical protein
MPSTPLTAASGIIADFEVVSTPKYPMQTRTRSRAAVLSNTSSTLPALPEPVQMQILDHLLTSYPEPDSVDYVLYPFKSTLGWMLSLQLVNKQW